MADTEAPVRPDSKEEGLPDNSNGVNRDIVYYYSREHRLNMSSPVVQGIYENKPSRPGLSKGLFGSKANLMVFVSIVIICIMFGMASRAAGARNLKLGGNSVDMVILREEGEQVLRITKKAPSSGEIYLGPVEITVLTALPEAKENGEAQEVFTLHIEFKALDSETFRVSLPDGDSFFVVLNNGSEQKSMKVKAAAKKK